MIILAKLIASLLMVNSLYFYWKSISDPTWIVAVSYPKRGDASMPSFSTKNYERRWRDRRRYIYFIATMIGFVFMAYWLAYGLLGFLPDNIGSYDEDGQFFSTRWSISMILGFIGGIKIPDLILNSSIRKLKSDADI